MVDREPWNCPGKSTRFHDLPEHMPAEAQREQNFGVRVPPAEGALERTGRGQVFFAQTLEQEGRARPFDQIGSI